MLVIRKRLILTYLILGGIYLGINAAIKVSNSQTQATVDQNRMAATESKTQVK